MPVWAISVAALLGALGAIFAVRFDVNRWREQNQESDERKLKALCPHVEMFLQGDGRIEIKSFITSPLGALPYHCVQCGMVLDGLTAERITVWWAARGEAKYVKDRKAFLKHAKRMGLTS